VQVWQQSPGWVIEFGRTVVTVGVAYAIGHAIRLILSARLTRLAGRTPAADWPEVILGAIRPRVGLWSVLAGLHLAMRRWPLDAAQRTDAEHVLSAVAIGSLTLAAAEIVTTLITTRGTLTTPAAQVSALTRNVVRIVITVLGGLTIVGIFGYNITPYLTALGVGGLAVALALQDPLSNLFAGIFMSASGQVRLGEYVKLDSGLEGYVLDFNWRATSIRLLSGNVAIVPNSKLAQSTVTNFHQPARDVGVSVELVVDYGNDLAGVERASLEVARSVVADVTGALKTAAPAVRFTSFVPGGITVAVSMRSEEFADQFLLKHELIKRLHDRFARDGITFRPAVPVVPPPHPTV
jgi:small-conductance mechanosensitive channel